MKAISLWQPWASAIAVGSKRIETRSWSTRYRGPLAIHAAKRRVIDEMIHFGCCWNWTGALWTLKFGMHPGKTAEERVAPVKDWLPFGAIVAVCDLVECWPTDLFTQAELDDRRLPVTDGQATAYLYAWTERQMGDFSLGRFGWVLENVRPLAKPFPCRGAQGLFDVDIPTERRCPVEV